MGKTTEAQKKASRKYSEKIDHISVNAPLGAKNRIQAVADGNVSGYVYGLVEQDLKRRHRNVVDAARKRIKKDLDSCKTVEEWHNAFSILLNELREEIEGQRHLESYIIEKLGQEALDKFQKNVSIPAFGDDTLRSMDAVNDFFEERGDCHWVDAPEDADEETLAKCKEYNTPEFLAAEDYKYLAHLYTSAVLRNEQIEAAIVNLLGEEAFMRLCSCGDYEKDRLYEVAMASTKNMARRQRLFIDWLAKRGLFAPDEEDEERGIEAEGWIPVKTKPTAALAVSLLLADGGTRVGLYVPAEPGKTKKEAWVSANRDYSALVIGWLPLHSKKTPRDTSPSFIDEAARLGIPMQNENWQRTVADAVNKQAMAVVFEETGIQFPPTKTQMEEASSLFSDMRCVIETMGKNGFCRKEQIWRFASENIEDTVRSIDQELETQCFLLATKAGLIKTFSNTGLYILTKAGKVLFEDAFIKPPKEPLFMTNGMVDPEEILHQQGIEYVEQLLLQYGYLIPFDGEEGKFPCDIYAEKDGFEFAVQVIIKEENKEGVFFEAETTVPRLCVPTTAQPIWTGDILTWGAKNICAALKKDGDAIVNLLKKKDS